ncbi:MAG: ArnT family glycosyltransferase [Pyrinomonadaceae bacterium]
MQSLTLAKRVWLLLFLAVIAFYFYGLGQIPFVGPDEPRYTEVAREMFLRRDLITPTLGGRTWFEKPPLLYWMMMASFRLFGINEWAARLGPAVSGVLTVLAVFWVGRRACRASLDHEINALGAWSAITAATTLGLIVFSRGVGFDIVVTMTITWSLSFFLVSEFAENEKQRRALLAGFYCFIGLSLLAKGLIGLIIPFGVIGTYQLLRREFPAKHFLLTLVWGLPLALAVSAVWYVPVIARHGWLFVDEFFIQHHFARYLSNKYHHPQPFYFYLLIIIPLSLPWTAFLVEALIRARTLKLRGADALDKQRVFALAWLLMPLAFFSFSGSKLPGYIVPVLPAAALIAGPFLAGYVSGRVEAGRRAVRATGAVLALFVIGGVLYVRSSGSLSTWCAVLIAAPLTIAALACLCFPQRRRPVSSAIICATLAAVLIALNCGLRGLAERESVKDLIQIANARGYGSAPVYALHEINRSLEFYAAGRVVYAADGDPMKLEGAFEVLEAAKKQNGPVLIVVPVEYVHQLTDLKEARADLLGNNGRVALLALSAR